MSARKASIRRFLPVAIAGTLITGVPAVTIAQTNPGFSFIWGGDGPGRKQQLNYVLQYGTPGHRNDRHRYKLGRQSVAMDSITVAFPDYFDGRFSAKNVTLRESAKGSNIFNFKKGKDIPLATVEYDEDNRVLELVPESPVPAGTRSEVVISNMKNPRSGGTYFINARITSPGDVPLSKYIGTWVVSIFRN
ncbi:hypothetical protein C1752_03880 [Acaryochloris thomasi RCC1774]|uniref:DUF2808 domain-containing protein n=1 Tax=Acaryochloris thomasi RCC1774 TaxID=1764569 RepID=A0A2W1JEV9_9CYAN|nr:DUF2808 domain-containing protein [Acaryochloris thomasi]PZD72293.1 hypothetical protein C1752_03880 [Acaryochloris thomasi RCC1774]